MYVCLFLQAPLLPLLSFFSLLAFAVEFFSLIYLDASVVATTLEIGKVLCLLISPPLLSLWLLLRLL